MALMSLENGSTPLHYASQSKMTTSIELLLREGADGRSVDNCGNSPLHMLCSWEQDMNRRLQIKNTSSDFVEIERIANIFISLGNNVDCENNVSAGLATRAQR